MEAITKTLILGDETISFPRLDMTDLFGLGDLIVAHTEKVARDLGKEEKRASHEIYNIVLQVRTRKPKIDEIIAACFEPEMAVAVIRKSMNLSKMDKAKQDEVLKKLDTEPLIDLAVALVRREQEEAPKEETQKNPLPVTQ